MLGREAPRLFLRHLPSYPFRTNTKRTHAVRKPQFKTQQWSPANKMGLNEPHLWLATPCVVPSHTGPVTLCDRQDTTEAMLCHLWDFSVKDTEASVLFSLP